jgi:malonyl-CoA/methylmalonyl-CoA synthetase
MCQSVTTAWDYRVTDRILHFLPLYHVHGLLNKLLCVLRVGGTVEFVPSAQAAALWHRLAQETLNDKGSTGSAPSEGTITKENTNIKSDKLTMFMAVPTVYAKMLEYANTTGSKEPIKSQVIAPALHCLQHQLRLMVSGSAALPDSLMHAWKALTTQTLLERYGMTEIGMALTNPYSPVSERKTGFVGKSFPFVQARLVEEETTTHAAGQRVITDANIPGELQIAGATVFKEYLNRPDATQESFVYADEEESAGDDNAMKERSLVRWFRTGDIAERDATGDYRILGRASADILKSSGYKISALEIERVLLSHPLVLEVAVCARPNDPLVGDRIVAIVTLREPTNAASASTTTASAGTAKQKKERQAVLEEYMRSQLAKYKHPHEWIFLQSALPRNHMGKVNKKSLLKDVQSLPQLS